MRPDVAMVVPVLVDADGERLLHIHRFNIAQATALARRGLRVALFLDAPTAARHEIDSVQVHLVPRWTSRLPGAHLITAALRTRPDILHQFHLMDVRTLALTALSPVRAFAEYNTGPVPVGVRRRVMRRASRRLEGLFFTSAAIADPFFDAGAIARSTPILEAPEISSLLPLGDRAAGRARLNLEESEHAVLVVARAAPVKDPFCALEAFERIRRHGPARLIWCALERGPLHAEVEARVRSMGGTVLVNVPMPDLYAAADVMLHTSLREACSAAFVEAMAASLPIVGSDIPAFRALAGDGGARLAPVSNPDAFAAEALTLLHDPEAGQRARARYQAALTYDRIAELKARAYASVS